MLPALRACSLVTKPFLLGARFISTELSQKEIFEVLDKEHTIYTIPAFKRDEDGKNYCRHLRKNGAIPGVLYGCDGKGNDGRVLIAVPTSEIDRFITRMNLCFESTMFYLDIEGEKVLVFPRQLSCHPTTELPENLNFIRMNIIKGTKAQIPIRYYNREKNREIKLGGFLSTATRFLDVRVKGDVKFVPPYINCNVDTLTRRRGFGVKDLDFDRSSFIPVPKMYSRIFASISGKVKVASDVEVTTTTTTTTTTTKK